MKPSLPVDESVWNRTVAMLSIVVITFGAKVPHHGPIGSPLPLALLNTLTKSYLHSASGKREREREISILMQ